MARRSSRRSNSRGNSTASKQLPRRRRRVKDTSMALPAEVVMPAQALSPKWSIAVDGLDAAQRQLVLDRMKAVSFDPREILFDQGEPSDTLLLLTEGRVRL